MAEENIIEALSHHLRIRRPRVKLVLLEQLKMIEDVVHKESGPEGNLEEDYIGGSPDEFVKVQVGEGCQRSKEFGEVREKDIKLACDDRRGVGESEMGDADDHRYRPHLWVP